MNKAMLEKTHEGRIVELTIKRGLRRAVPRGFRYISVEWGEREMNSSKKQNISVSENVPTRQNKMVQKDCTGLVLVFDRESELVDDDGQGKQVSKDDFCLDVLAGLLDQDPYRFRRKIPFSAKDQENNLRKFKQDWIPLDWTQYYS
jgi:hypothetical protein